MMRDDERLIERLIEKERQQDTRVAGWRLRKEGNDGRKQE